MPLLAVDETEGDIAVATLRLPSVPKCGLHQMAIDKQSTTRLPFQSIAAFYTPIPHGYFEPYHEARSEM